MLSNPNPDGWTEMTFGEMAEQISERVDDPKTADVEVYVGLEHLDPEDLRIRRRGTPDDVEATKLRVRPGQIIFGKRRAYQRKVAVADFDGIASAHAMILQEKPSLYPGFLPFFMQSDVFMDRAVTISEGGLSPTIKWKTLAAEKFLLPPPEQQRELVELMQGFEKAVEAGEEVGASTRSAFDALASKLYNSNYPRQRLDQLCKKVTDGTHAGIKKSDVGTIPFLLVSHVRPYKIGWQDADFVTQDQYDIASQNRKAKLGDILYTVVGSYGFAAEVDVAQDFTFQRHIALISPNEEKLLSRYLLYWLNSREGIDWGHKVAVGNAQKTITLKALRGCEIPCPEVGVQNEIITKLDSLFNVLKSSADGINVTKRLKTSILNTALSPSAQAEAATEVTA